MSDGPVIVGPGEGHRVGNVEFLARTTDTPRFNFGIIEMAPVRRMESHVHENEDDSFYILEGEMTFFFGDESAVASPGTFVLVPPGVSHGFENEGRVQVRMLIYPRPRRFRPAHRPAWVSTLRARGYKFLKYLATGKRVKPAFS